MRILKTYLFFNKWFDSIYCVFLSKSEYSELHRKLNYTAMIYKLLLTRYLAKQSDIIVKKLANSEAVNEVQIMIWPYFLNSLKMIRYQTCFH